MLKALTTRASGINLAISSAAELPAGVSNSSIFSKFTGLEISTKIFPASAALLASRMLAIAAYGTANTTISPARFVRPSLPTKSTSCPPEVNTLAIACPIFPCPKIVMFAIICSSF